MQNELDELESELSRIKVLEASPESCIEAIRNLNVNGSNKDAKDFDKIGRVKVRIVLDAEQSLNEKAFRINRVTKTNMGWSDTDFRDNKDVNKRKGRK